VTTPEHNKINYPDHPERKETARYRRTHHKLCVQEKTPCFICGTLTKTETHHFFCEWAAAGAIDWLVFGKHAEKYFNPQTGTQIGPAFDWKAVQKDPETFVDAPENMVVLCVDHHRSKTHGIHHVPYPEWILQRAAKSGYKFID
jgi:hypothetical protein